MLAFRAVVIAAVAACMVHGAWVPDDKKVDSKKDLLNQLRGLLRELDEESKVENLSYGSENGPYLTKKSVSTRGVQTLTTETVYTASGSSRSIDVKADCLYAHNKVRALHQNTPDLEYDDDLAEGAQKWAEHLASIGNPRLHSPESERPGQGENLFFNSVGSSLGNSQATPAVAVFKWYAESWEYNYNYNVNDVQNAGHFTQVVWKGSTKVGCGVATVTTGGSDNTYIVGRYSPAGNFGGEYTSNVMPMKAGAQAPKRTADIEMGGCADYGEKCSLFFKYMSDFCEKMGNAVCQCTCQ